MPSNVFGRSHPQHHLTAVLQVNCSTWLVHWRWSPYCRRLSVSVEQTAGACWL